MDERFDDDFRPRRRPKLTAWLFLLFLPIALMLPSFAENLRVAVIGREVVCCGPENREELEKQAEIARSKRDDADLIMKVGLIGSMALAGLGTLGFLLAVVRLLPGFLKVIFGLAVIAIGGYIIFASYRMYDYYTNNTEDYYQVDAWEGFRSLEWYSPATWF